MKPLDKLLNNLTMYRVVLYGLNIITAAAGVLSLTGHLSYSVWSLALSVIVIGAAGLAAHLILRKIYGAATGSESWRITILILFLILKPPTNLQDCAVLALASVLAVASKYVLALNARHIFNPAAVALVILGLLGSGEIFWWVGNQALLPVVAIIGLLVVRKQRRFQMVLTFVAVALVTSALAREGGFALGGLVRDTILSGPIIFFASIMLTEPATAPSTHRNRLIYASIVGVSYGVHFAIGPLFSNPELALVIGNVFAYAVGYKRRLRLQLRARREVTHGVHEFTFMPDQPLQFISGQYMEWTLPHKRPDSRGNRRYLTIASPPGINEVCITTRFPADKASTFKKALAALQPGDTIWASQLGGDFVLPRTGTTPIVWIAGGIGITPFKSMAEQLIASGQTRDITLFYSAVTADGFSYWEVFNQATANGIKPKYLLSGPDIPEGWGGLTGYLSAELIANHIADPMATTYYLSGPPAMVDSYKRLLRSMGISRRQIRTDYFPGL